MSPQLNVPKKNGVIVDNTGTGYPPSFDDKEYPKTAREFEVSYEKTGKIPFTGMPQRDPKTKSPYSKYFSQRKDLKKRKNVKSNILKKGGGYTEEKDI